MTFEEAKIALAKAICSRNSTQRVYDNTAYSWRNENTFIASGSFHSRSRAWRISMQDGTAFKGDEAQELAKLGVKDDS